MRFSYQYRTSDNSLHNGEVRAPSREAAFSVLRAQGIKPSRLYDAPGLANKLIGRGKRWITIFALAILAAAAAMTAMSLRHEVEDLVVYERRSQIYGDPVVLREAFENGWTDAFDNPGDRFLAKYAVPGRVVAQNGNPPLEDIAAALRCNVPVAPQDFAEIAKMKRIVNGMKREAREYVKAGGSIAGYVRRLSARQVEESRYYERIKTELSECDDMGIWKERNAALRAMGLPMVEPREQFGLDVDSAGISIFENSETTP